MLSQEEIENKYAECLHTGREYKMDKVFEFEDECVELLKAFYEDDAGGWKLYHQILNLDYKFYAVMVSDEYQDLLHKRYEFFYDIVNR